MAEDAQAAAMKQRMQQDVTAWSASRAEAPTPPLVARRAPARATTAKPAAVKAPAAGAPAAPALPRKPFSMKYDGQSASRHAAERFARGAR